MVKPYKHLLNKKQHKHLKEFGMITMKIIKKTVAVQRHHRRNDGGSEPCYECKNIARKLGLPI